MRTKRKSRRINSYTKPKTIKQDVPFPYKRVRIDWIDIITEGGWGTDKEFKDMKQQPNTKNLSSQNSRQSKSVAHPPPAVNEEIAEVDEAEQETVRQHSPLYMNNKIFIKSRSNSTNTKDYDKVHNNQAYSR